MNIAQRMSRLGTETAFAVAADAARHAATGATVFPFHLGDLNLKTPDNVMEAACRAMYDGKTGYCPNGGVFALREALADDVNSRRGTAYTAGNVSIQPGGKPVIGKFLQVLMNPGDEVLCPSPGYPIYESQIEYFGGTVVPYGFQTDGKGFRINFEDLEKAVTPRTKLLIVNDFQNPTGATCTEAERQRIAELAIRHDMKVLLDEAYFEIRYAGTSSSIVSLPGMEERSVLLYTFSKKFAMTGWRLGAAVGPGPIIDCITQLNVNDESCTNHFVQYAGLAGLTGDQSGPRRIVETLRERRDVAVALVNEIPGVTCFTPEASFYLYPDVTDLMEARGFGGDYAAFSGDVLARTGVSFCTRLHFGKPLPSEQRRHIRLAYSGIDTETIRAGLAAFKGYAQGRSG
jgi:aspartate/methionine/tyrosine aminotransferase